MVGGACAHFVRAMVAKMSRDDAASQAASALSPTHSPVWCPVPTPNSSVAPRNGAPEGGRGEAALARSRTRSLPSTVEHAPVSGGVCLMDERAEHGAGRRRGLRA